MRTMLLVLVFFTACSASLVDAHRNQPKTHATPSTVHGPAAPHSAPPPSAAQHEREAQAPTTARVSVTEPTAPAVDPPVVPPRRGMQAASSGWHLVQRGEDVGSAELTYESVEQLLDDEKDRGETELLTKAAIARNLRSIPAGGYLHVADFKEDIEDAEPNHWLVIVRVKGKDVARARGRRSDVEVVSSGFMGSMMLRLPKFQPPAVVYLVSANGDRWEYDLTKD
jgi:hypothetical protein